jgi:hypothetical protein
MFTSRILIHTTAQRNSKIDEGGEVDTRGQPIHGFPKIAARQQTSGKDVFVPTALAGLDRSSRQRR